MAVFGVLYQPHALITRDVALDLTESRRAAFFSASTQCAHEQRAVAAGPCYAMMGRIRKAWSLVEAMLASRPAVEHESAEVSRGAGAQNGPCGEANYSHGSFKMGSLGQHLRL
jgi:hypothetical protein